MKKILLLSLIGLLATSCYTVYQVIPKTHSYSESISFTIDKIEEGKSVATGNGSYNASRGNKFVFVFLTLKNNLDEKQELDFDNFLLLNPKTKTKHKAEWSMVPGPINMWGKIDSYIRKGDEKRRKLVFIFPDEDKAKMLMVNDQIIEIEYTK
ncbi:DUF4352 domain-containing protein [Aequorivita sinensis]|jgi:hypothetical protein|uniref:DUF4352 domain-containing protein n=1 Tax=Aequorivita sinensis TaxID=1382458 RepID=UPI0022FFFF11|nr:DUF4352 domain-containing protein [Aequorivita sinensis]|tara:strand:- start:61 stop:519 length:459 start_codon:yes stop_codon:yes gene_type:complete